MHDEAPPIAMTLEQLKELAVRVSGELKAASATPNPPAELRARFIKVRTALFQRGIFDPVLVRFDTATAPQASTAEIADQLATVARSL